MTPDEARTISLKVQAKKQAEAQRLWKQQEEDRKSKENIIREEAKEVDLPAFINDLMKAAEEGKRNIEYYAGNSENRDSEFAIKADVIRQHMEELGYKAKRETYEPCNEGETASSYYWRFSW